MDTEDLLQPLIRHFRELVRLTSDDVDRIRPHLEIRKCRKKEFLLRPGEISSHMRFIAKGCLRCYYPDENAQERVLQLGIENWWINDLYSYLSAKPSRMFIQALEESVIIQIHRDHLEHLFGSVPAVESFFRIKLQNAYVALQERTLEQLSVDAYERYVRFRVEYRDLEQRIPQYMIASYLGVTPEFLSYLRKKHAGTLS